MASRRFVLLAGGVISGLISLLHVAMALKPDLYRYFGPAQDSALAQWAVAGSSATTIATIALAAIFALWAAYAFAGVGLIGRLPLLRGMLIAIGVIYVLRSLFLPSEIKMVLAQGYPIQFPIFSALSLVTGLLYLVGTALSLRTRSH